MRLTREQAGMVKRAARDDLYILKQDPVRSRDIKLVTTLGRLYEPVPLRRLETTPFYAVSLVAAKMQRYRYKFIVDGQAELDRINPQTEALSSGDVWSSV